MNTYMQRPEDANHDWLIVDATDKILGRLATEVVNRLRGKHKPEFTNHVDGGDFVVVVNAEKIKVTGNKLDKKMYYKHTGYVGGIKSRSLKEMQEKNPELVILNAVRGMLPKNRLSRQVIKKLKVYSGSEHPHEAQAPKTLDI